MSQPPAGFKELESRCTGNSICMVEAFKHYVDQGVEFSGTDVKRVSSLLGEATKKIEVFSDKYLHVFMKYVQRNCVEVGEGEICIYSWKPGTRVRYFPVSLDATGTILYFRGGNISVLAYPTHRAYDISGHKVKVPDPSIAPVSEVTKRIDGYQITLYYNPILKEWIPATRYVLHNMVYVRRRLEVHEFEEIVNPYVSIAHSIAEERGLYDKLKGYEGWTFTFVLEAPEPAITRPSIELFDPTSFKLYLLNARKPNGELLTVGESSKLLDWPTVPVEEVHISSRHDLDRLIDEWSVDLSTRSRFVRYAVDEPYRPYTLEVPSKLYGEAMSVKYMSNPKSIVILASHGFGEEAVKLLTDFGDIKDVGKEIVEYYEKIQEMLPKAVDAEWFLSVLKEHGVDKPLRGELEKARRTGTTARLARKLASILAGDNLYEGRDRLRKFVESLDRLLREKT